MSVNVELDASVGGPLASSPGGPRHSAATVRRGRWLTGLTLLALIGVGLAGAYYAYRGYWNNRINAPLVALVLLSWALAFVLMLGYDLSNVADADWRPLRWPLVIVTVVQCGLSVVVAAYSHWLERASWLAYSWVPTGAYHTLRGWVATDWFAIPTSLPVWIVWTAIVVFIATRVRKGIAAIFGDDSWIAGAVSDYFGGVTKGG